MQCELLLRKLRRMFCFLCLSKCRAVQYGFELMNTYYVCSPPLCWLLWNAAIECNIMPPLAAFPMHYYPAAQCIQSCHLIRSCLDCQIQRYTAPWRLRIGATGSKVRFARDPGGTGGRGIADRFCYADFPVLLTSA
jgi:hypothetical protein